MNIQRLNDWLQVGASVGVFAGLILVAYQLRQDHQLARAQLAADAFATHQELRMSLREPDTARAFVKAHESPGTLTLEEQVVLDAFYEDVIAVVVGRNMLLVDMGIFEPFVLNSNAAAASRLVFASEYGRQWWAVVRNNYTTRLREAIDAVAKSTPEESRMELMLQIKEQATRETER